MPSDGWSCRRPRRKTLSMTWPCPNRNHQTGLNHEVLQSTLEPKADYHVLSVNPLVPGVRFCRAKPRRHVVPGGNAAVGAGRGMRALQHSRLYGHARCHLGAPFILEHAAATSGLAVGAF